MKPLQIYACGDQYHTASEPLSDLKSITQQATGKAHRRIGRFIQLALTGAARCQTTQAMPPDTGVYFASSRGDLELTLEIMTQLFRHGQTPKPLHFVNTVSNAASFYIAQTLGLHSRSNFACNHYFAFESAVQLATLDLHLSVIDSALVGSVDIATHPLHEHRQRLHLAPDTPIGEGSHWLWLGKPNGSRPRIGELKDSRHFVDRNELLHWLGQLPLMEHCAISAGQYLASSDFTELQIISGIKHRFFYRIDRAYYDSQSGAVISCFLQSEDSANTLLHINADDQQRYSVMLVSR